MNTDRKIACVPSDGMSEWYTLEWAEHDGREWLEKTEYGAAFQHSGRICDADVEGSADEFLTIAEAIENGASIYFKRCAVEHMAGGFAFWSPRNSQRRCEVSTEIADGIALSIRAELARREETP